MTQVEHNKRERNKYIPYLGPDLHEHDMEMAMHYIYCHFRLKVLLNLANRKKGACGAPERKQKSSTDILMMAAPQVANKKKEKEKKALGAAKNVQWLPTANIQLWILTHRIT
jgi:hypothetical protein